MIKYPRTEAWDSQCRCPSRSRHLIETHRSERTKVRRAVGVAVRIFLLCFMRCCACCFRERVKREKDKQRREVARRILAELEDSLSRGLALVAHEQDHPGIKPQADRGKVQ